MHFLRKLETLISFGMLMMIADRFTVASGSERVLQEIELDYKNCLKTSSKLCYGDTEGCVKRRDCALLATVDFSNSYTDGVIEITASHRCLKEDGKSFLSAIAFELKGKIREGGSPSCDSFSEKNFRVYQLWDGERCKLSQGDPKRERYLFNKHSKVNLCLGVRNDKPGVIFSDYIYYTSVAVTSAGMTDLTKESTQEAQTRFLSPLLKTYKHVLGDEDKLFYITEMGKSPNVASEILHSWFTFALLAFVIISNQF